MVMVWQATGVKCPTLPWSKYSMSTVSRCRVRTVCKKMLMACMLVGTAVQFQIVLVQLTAAFTCHVDIFLSSGVTDK